MKYLSKISLSALFLVTHAAFATEPPIGWYGGLMLGPSFVPSSEITVTNLPFFPPFFPDPFDQNTATGRVSYGVGGNIAAQLGTRCNKFRVEGEVLYNVSPVSRIILNGLRIESNQGLTGFRFKATTTIIAGFVNGFYELYDEDYSDAQFIPYVGLGLGYANIKNSLTIYRFHIPLTPEFGTTNAPIGQVIGGVSYLFSSNASFGIDLRYMTTKTISRFNTRVEVASLNFLVNWAFDQPNGCSL